MADPCAPVQSPREDRTHGRFLPVRWTRTTTPTDAALSMALLLHVGSEWPYPFQFGLTIEAGDHRPAASALTVHAPTADLADAAAQTMQHAAATLTPWLGLGEPATKWHDHTVTEPTAGWRFVPGGTASPLVVGDACPFVETATRMQGRWQLTLTTGSRDEPAAPDEAATYRCGIALLGDGPSTPESELLATLVAADVAGWTAVEPVRLDEDALGLIDRECRQAGVRTNLVLTTGALGHLLSMPQRAVGNWPVVPRAPEPPERFLDLARAAQPPHILLTGGSGLGKTTTLEALLRADLAAGNTIIVIDRHGDLAGRTCSLLDHAPQPSTVLDFAAADPPLWNLTAAEPGFAPGEWAGVLADVIRALWSDMPAEYFGPVYERGIHAATRVLVEDPAGPWPIVHLPRLFEQVTRGRPRFDGRDALLWDALRRIDDGDLTDIWANEIRPMLTHRDSGNARIFFTGKVGRIVDDAAIRRVVATPTTTFSLHPTIAGNRHFVASLPAVALSDAGARLLAGALLGRIWLLARRMRDTDTPLAIYLDEWHSIPAPDLAAMLPEGRKFRLRLRLANQNAAQLPNELLDAALGNCGLVATFRTGPRDAALLEGSFSTVTADAIRTLPDHWIAATAGDTDLVTPSPGPFEHADPEAAVARLHTATLEPVRRALYQAIATAARSACTNAY